jgi:ABC-2 type transport system ATP-binding protein
MALLVAEGISKSFGSFHALRNISFSAEHGEIVALTGENGAGKSTLLSILATEIKPGEGDVFLSGESIVSKPGIAVKKIAYVPQEIMLHRNLSVNDNLNFWAAAHGLKRKSAEKERIVDLLGLSPYLKSKVRDLSIGMQRRVNISAALFAKPLLMLMDEPTAGLDASSRAELTDFVLNMRKGGTTFIYATHMQDEVEKIADKVLHLKEGQAVGLYKQPG